MLSRCFGNKSKRTPGQKFGDVESTTDQSTKQTNKQTSDQLTKAKNNFFLHAATSADLH